MRRVCITFVMYTNPTRLHLKWKKILTKYCGKSFGEKEQEVEVEKVILKTMIRRMNKPTIKIKEDEEELVEADFLSEVSM